MSKPLNPGPPLVAGDEFCPDAPPTIAGYIKASLAALLVVAAGAAASLALALYTGHFYAAVVAVTGLFAGWFIRLAADCRRSLVLGIMAASTTLCSLVGGYGLLLLPLVNAGATTITSAPWSYLLSTAAGLFLAYRIAGPRYGGRSI
ncbi:MAG: hypothetical protein ACM3XM_03100 [Mycobacterium leprae]